MSKRIDYRLTLSDDVIVSHNTASVGGHRSQDYIRGNILLGVAASKSYKDLANNSWAVFHSGKVRFGNAFPYSPANENNGRIDAKLRACPVPIALEAIKYRQAEQQQLINRYVQTDTDTQQSSEKISQSFMHIDAQNAIELLTLAKVQHLKTAIDFYQRNAASAQLFNYQALCAGQQFAGFVDFDDDISDALIEQISAAMQGQIRLGRSRSAQYGRVICEVSAPYSYALQAQAPSADNSLVLWLQADLAAIDSWGRTTLSPDLADLGLISHKQGAHFQPIAAKSFIRSHRYSLYNNFRRGYDIEREVIQQGSILSYQLPPAVTLSDLMPLLSAGIGLYRESGLGQVIVNPPQLLTLPIFNLKLQLKTQEVQTALPDEPALIQWLQQHQNERELSDSASKTSNYL